VKTEVSILFFLLSSAVIVSVGPGSSVGIATELRA